MAPPSQIGRYQVRERLGQGGMGVLYLALDPAIDRLVALKLLRVNQAEIRERFLREARLAARLQHPNIVTVFDVGEHDGQPFIAMEYIPGETLAEVIARRAPVPLGRRLEWLVDACKGLGYAHKHGVVHRDVKPANLMISRDSGVLKVLDFGIARGIDSQLTQAGMLMGTPSYMSPEQLEGRALDHRSDIFALGLVLYEVLTYQQAFSGETPHAVWNKVVSLEPRPILEVNPSLDPALAGIVERAICKRVEDRCPDLERLRSELQKVVQRLDTDQASSTVVAQSPTPSSPIRRSGVARVAERRAAQIAAHLERAEAALAAQNLEQAQEAVEEAAMLDPDDSRVLALLERVKHEQDAADVAGWLAQAEAAMRSGALTAAAGLVDRALHTMPDHAPALGLQSAVQQAIEARERAQERARLIARALEQATEHLGAGAYEAALRSTTEALGFDPQSRAALELRERVQRAASARISEVVGLARADAAAERFNTALRRLQELSPRNDTVDRVENEIRDAWLAADRRKQAEDAERRAREDAARRRDQADALLRQARDRMAANEFAGAISLVDAALAIEPARADAQELRQEIDRAWANHQVRRERAESVRRALTRARSLADEGRHHDAIASLEPYKDDAPAASLITSLRAAAADLEARARADADRQARDTLDRRVLAAIARAQELLQEHRGEEALASLQAFSPADTRIVDTIAALRRELQDRAESQRATDDARAAETVQRARREADQGHLGAAIARLERALPRHPLIEQALTTLRDTHDRLAHETSARALTLASRGREADALGLLQQFDPPHPAVADALIRLRAESAAREARRQADAAAHQRAAEAEAERAAVDAWVDLQCERARAALRNGQFGEAKQLAQAALTRAPDAADAAQILDEAIAGQAESEAASARRREIARALTEAATALEAGDAATARMHVEAAASVGASAREIGPLRDRIAAFEAERDARQRQALHDRRAATAVDAARTLFESGQRDAAVRRLEGFDPPHPSVSAALTELRAARERFEAQRLQALAAERARAAAAAVAAQAAADAAAEAEARADVADDGEGDAAFEAPPVVADGPRPLHAVGASAAPAPRRRLTSNTRAALIATAAVAVISIGVTGLWLVRGEAPVGGGEAPTVTKPETPKSEARVEPLPPARPQVEPESTPPESARPPEPEPEPATVAGPIVPLVIDAAPWAQVTRIANTETQAVVALDTERNTPYVAQLPTGVYEVTVQRFDRSQKRRVTLRNGPDNRVLFEFDPVDVDEYLRRVGS